jgi:glycosyltransferase involved in cell wall biosynthesis
MKAGLSVVMPLHNGARYVRQALASIACQNWPELQVIVVDDGSTDDGPSLVRDFELPIQLVQQDQKGPSAARNLGVELSRYPFTSFLDADDIWPIDRRQLVEPLLTSTTDAILGKWQRFSQSSSELEFAAPQSCLALGTSVVRTNLFQQIGPFDETLRFNEDVDWFLRARDAGCQIELVQHVLLWHRRHATNMTANSAFTQTSLLSILGASIRRRRANISAN